MLVYILFSEVFTFESFLIKLTCQKKYHKRKNFLPSLPYTMISGHEMYDINKIVSKLLTHLAQNFFV